MIHLIAYDITEDSKRNRICSYLSGWGRRIQKSVFECDLNQDELQQIESYIQTLIDIEKDRCHIYRLCAECITYQTAFGNDLEPKLEQTVVV